MIKQTTIDKLHDLRLSPMSRQNNTRNNKETYKNTPDSLIIPTVPAFTVQLFCILAHLPTVTGIHKSTKRTGVISSK